MSGEPSGVRLASQLAPVSSDSAGSQTGPASASARGEGVSPLQTVLTSAVLPRFHVRAASAVETAKEEGGNAPGSDRLVDQQGSEAQPGEKIGGSIAPPTVRYRLRFAKLGDTRWISHRDLGRAVERWFRRAGLPLAMTGGFHPTPKINIPAALAVGIVGRNEVLEFELLPGASFGHGEAEDLSRPIQIDRLQAALERTAPPGLVCQSLCEMAAGSSKVRVVAAEYRIGIPDGTHDGLQQAITRFAQSATVPVTRIDRDLTLDLKAYVQRLWVDGSALCFSLDLSLAQGLRPSELLRGLGLSEWLELGVSIERSAVRLADEPELPGSVAQTGEGFPKAHEKA